jgi:predicted ATPase
LHQAGERALQLSAYREAVAHLTRGLALLKALPDSGGEDQRLNRDQQELAMQVALGMAWAGHKAFGPQAERAYTRARELSQRMGKTSELCLVLGELSTGCYVRAEHQRARQLGEEMLNLAREAMDPLLVAVGHWYLGFVSFALGKYSTALGHLEKMITFYNAEQHHSSLLPLRGSDVGTSALAYAACCLWCLGYPEQALRRSQEALALARELAHPLSLADVLCYAGCMLSKMRRDGQALKDYAEELIRLANEKVPGWSGEATRLLGEALTMLGQVQEGMTQIREAMALEQSVSTRCYLPRTLGSLAEAQAQAGQSLEGLTTLAEALALVEETDERHWEAEVYRVRGKLLLAQGDEADAAASFHKAIEVARGQSARSWELRATVSLCRLWQQQGRREEAHKRLAEIYDWFTEGFETRDLIEAKTLLEELSS